MKAWTERTPKSQARHGRSRLVKECEGVGAIKVTYAICTRNRGEQLKIAIDSVLSCIGARCDAELLVLDNGSTDHTASILDTYERFGARRLFYEPASLPVSRWMMIDAAAGELVCFVDDDNEVAPEHLDALLDLAQQHKRVAAFGGNNEGVFDGEIPVWLQGLAGYLAIGPQSQAGDFDGSCDALWTSGMAVRKAACEQLRNTGFTHIMQDRSEDTELSYALRLSGWNLAYSSQLKMKHHLPSQRYEASRFASFYRDTHYRNGILQIYNAALSGICDANEAKNFLKKKISSAKIKQARLSASMILRPRNEVERRVLTLHSQGMRAHTQGMLHSVQNIKDYWPKLELIRSPARQNILS